MAEIGRLITAMLTPFDQDGGVNYGEARRLAKGLIASGSDGVVVSGTTGESPTLTVEEKLRLFSEVKDAVGDGAAVVGGTSSYSTAESVELSREAEKAGVDALLLVEPYYNKPPQEGLYQHFKTVAESVSVPCVLYTVNSRTRINVDYDTTVRLSEVDNIVGIKEASSDLDQVTRVIRDTGDGFRVWSGNDNETLYIMSLGGYGVVSVLSHVVGNQIKAMMGMILEGEIENAGAEHRRLLEMFKIGFVWSNPIPVRHMVARAGYAVGKPRLPLVPPDEATAAKIEAVMDAYDIDLPDPSTVA